MKIEIEQFKKKFNAESLGVLLIPVVLIIVAFLDILLANNVFVGEYHDIMVYQIPHMLFDNPGFPLWNNMWITGFPEFASPQSDIYYPLTLPLFYMIGDVFTLVNFSVLLHLFIAFITSYLLLGLITKNRTYLIIFSLAYIFSALILTRVYAGHELIVFTLAWTPLLYYAFVKMAYKKELNVQNILIFSVSSILIFFTGALYYIVYPYIFMAIFLLYLLATKQTEIKTIAALAISTVIFLLVTSIKSLPVLSISDKITRMDALDPLGGGGSLESSLASLMFGTPINKGYSYTGLQYGIHESTVLIGIIAVFLVIIALVYGKRNIAIPSFFAVVFAFIWADAGKSIFSFIHLLPLVSSFRCPGRIFGSLLPILLVLAVYGAIILCSKIKENKDLVPDEKQKKLMLYGIIVLVLLKLTELPYQEGVTLQSAVAILIAAAFIGLLYFNKATSKNILYFFAGAAVIEIVFVLTQYNVLNITVLGKIIVIGAAILALIYYEIKKSGISGIRSMILVLIGLNIIICSAGGLSYIQGFNPELDTSPANEIVKELDKYPTENIQKWATTTGRAFDALDYTYILVENGIHATQGYTGYYLNTRLPLTYNIENEPYFISDYIIDVEYANSGHLSIENYTAMIAGIPVTVPDRILPNAFISRNDAIVDADIVEFTPDKVVMTGDFKAGDVAVLKYAYYDGWQVNGAKASPVVNMIGGQINSDTDTVTFEFKPSTFTTGLILSVIGIIAAILLVVMRGRVESSLKVVPEVEVPEVKSKSKKSKSKK